MIDQLFSMFSSSRQGQGALQQLMGQGYSQQQASGMLQAAFPAAAQAMAKAGPGFLSGGGGTPGAQGAQGQGLGGALMNIGGSNYAQNFIAGAMSSLLRGEGLMGAATDGLQGVVGGHVASVIATRFGLPSRVAGAVGAVMTPWMIDFLWEKMRGGSTGGGFNLDSLFSGSGASAPAGLDAGSGFGSGFSPPTSGGWVIPGAAKGDAGNKASAGAYSPTYGGYAPAPMGAVFNKDIKKSVK